MQMAHALQLAEMLIASAVSFEFLEERKDFAIRLDCPDQRVPLVKQLCDDAGSWFQLLAMLPHDATYSI